jgi:hypothetical protein
VTAISNITPVAAPCAKCPFRKDVPIYLYRERRREIAEALLSGSPFWCHSTVDYDSDDDEPGVSNARPCGGAERALDAIGRSSQLARIAERLGETVRVEGGAECWDLTEWTGLPEGATGDDPGDTEGETCEIVNAGCEAPAGYMVGGGVVHGDVFVDWWCPSCGVACCDSCRVDDLCGNCADEEG